MDSPRCIYERTDDGCWWCELGYVGSCETCVCRINSNGHNK